MFLENFAQIINGNIKQSDNTIELFKTSSGITHLKTKILLMKTRPSQQILLLRELTKHVVGFTHYMLLVLWFLTLWRIKMLSQTD